MRLTVAVRSLFPNISVWKGHDAGVAHKLIALFGKSQRVFCKYEISLGGKGIRIHKITSLTDGFSVILIQNFGIDTVELFSWKKAKKLPALIQSFDDASILCF